MKILVSGRNIEAVRGTIFRYLVNINVFAVVLEPPFSKYILLVL